MVLAGVVFIPELIRDRDLGRSLRQPAPTVVAPEAKGDVPAPAEPPARQEKRAPESLGKTSAPDDDAPLAEVPMMQTAPPPGEDGRGARIGGRREQADLAAAAEQEAVAAELEEESAAARDRFAPVPPAAPEARAREGVALREPVPPAERQRASAPAKKAKGGLETAEATEADARFGDFEGGTPPAIDVFVVDLPADARTDSSLSPLRVIEARAEWEAWLAGSYGPALVRLGEYDSGRRLVLIGPPGGADCSSLMVMLDSHGYRVRLGQTGASPGCAFLLPRDGLPVSLDR
ncbi:MAG: hypothetical protein ACYTFI_06670 [Planctomycetota bacterium]